jgi:hypothetical protein
VGAKRILDRLVAAGILDVVQQTWPRFYVARDLLQVIEAPVAEE